MSLLDTRFHFLVVVYWCLHISHHSCHYTQDTKHAQTSTLSALPKVGPICDTPNQGWKSLWKYLTESACEWDARPSRWSSQYGNGIAFSVDREIVLWGLGENTPNSRGEIRLKTLLTKLAAKLVRIELETYCRINAHEELG